MVARFSVLLAGCLLAGAPAEAAPLRPFGPVDVCGEIVVFRWHEAQSAVGRPGFSGSLGRDRSFPARFGVVLKRHRGVDPESVGWVNGALRGASGDLPTAAGELILVVSGDDAALLEGARSLCVHGFRIRGDEGGTWTFHDRLDVKR